MLQSAMYSAHTLNYIGSLSSNYGSGLKMVFREALEIPTLASSLCLVFSWKAPYLFNVTILKSFHSAMFNKQKKTPTSILNRC